MSRRARRPPSDPQAVPTQAGLTALGLRRGQPVRFRRQAGDRWQRGVAFEVEKDGSLGLRDGNGAFRAIPVDLIEVEVDGRRGSRAWEPLLARASRSEQLRLL